MEIGDSLKVFFDAQQTRIENTLRIETRSEQINRKLQREALSGVDALDEHYAGFTSMNTVPVSPEAGA